MLAGTSACLPAAECDREIRTAPKPALRFERDRDECCRAQAEQLDEEVAAGHRAKDSPERVQPVQPGDPLANVRIGADEMTGKHRQRHPHEQGYRRQGDESQAEPDQRHLARREIEVCAAEEGRDDVEGQRHQQGEKADGDLQQAVDGERTPQSCADRRADERADSEPGQEGRYRRDDGLRRVAEDQDEILSPDDLVDQPGRAGCHEQDRDQRVEATRSRHRTARRLVAVCSVRRANGIHGVRVSFRVGPL